MSIEYGHYLNPTNDYAFKRIFGDQNHSEILISFLNSLLDFQGEHQITQVDILNPYQAPKLPELKETVLDVRCKDQAGREFIVEMQLADKDDFDKRSLYYTAKSYAHQLNKQQEYRLLQ